jgi:hypothetical protein
VDPLFSAEPFFIPFSQYFLTEQSGSIMPRRPPPTPLLLVHGPLPSRGGSKFTLPSVPRPTFHPQTAVVRRRVPGDPIEAGVMRGVAKGDLAAPSKTLSR